MDSRGLVELMTRYQAGDARAFDELFQALQGRILSYLLHRTRNREAAEDLFQEVFMKLHRHRDTWLPGSPVEPWIFAIARHCADDRGRKLARTKEDAVEQLEAVAPEPERLPDEVVAALAQLPDGAREVLVLTKVEGLTSEEAARRLGTTPGAVKLRVHRAVGRLRALLGAKEDS